MTALRSMSLIATGGGIPPHDRLLKYITAAVVAGGTIGALHGCATSVKNILTNNRGVTRPLPLYVGVTAGTHAIYGMVAGPIAPIFVWQVIQNSTNCEHIAHIHAQIKKVRDAL
jgi:hypothetical protein